jgi:parallel beta-helix repeat protein
MTLAATLLVLLALLIGAAPAPAGPCTAITTLPAVITVQGVYCFTGNLETAMTSGDAILISTNNVVLDLNGFKLGGLAAGTATTAQGIHALNARNVTIKNGTVRGFFVGIVSDQTIVNASEGNIVEDIRADRNTNSGIIVNGPASIIRNNAVIATGGTTQSIDAVGIAVEGRGTRVLNNDVIQVVKQDGGTAYGIFLSGCANCLAVNNRITDTDQGITYSFSTGKYRDNLTFNVTTPFTGGTDAGNNN